MRVGLIYDLRAEYLAAGFGEEETAEFDRPDTIDSIEGSLNELGYDTDRVGNVRQLVNRLAAGDRWDIVFSIAEGLYGYGREAQVPALLDAFGIPYAFSDPLVLSLTLHKALTKHVLRDLGIRTPDFRLVESDADIARVDLPFPLFVKPVAEGTAKGITDASKVTSSDELARECRRVVSTYHQPALVEEFLPGREFTVGITGTGEAAVAVGTMEIILRPEAEPHSYTYVNKERCEELCDFPMADPASAAEAEALSLAVWRALGCRDAGRVDVRVGADGHIHFMEVNPLPGLHPSHSDLPMICTARGISYLELISRIMDSARRRIVGTGHPGRSAGNRLRPPSDSSKPS